MTEEESTEIAQGWMEIADVDGSGTIDEAEYIEFLQKLDETMEADAIKEIFANADSEGSGALTVEQFGQALHESLKTMKKDEGEGEGEGEGDEE